MNDFPGVSCQISYCPMDDCPMVFYPLCNCPLHAPSGKPKALPVECRV